MESARTSLLWLVLLLCSSIAQATPIDTLLFEPEARDRFVQQWEPAIPTLRFRRPGGLDSDPALRVLNETSAVCVANLDGKPSLLAPLRHLHGVSKVDIVFSDGATAKARLEANNPDQNHDATMVELVTEDPKALAQRPILQWAPDDSALPGRRGWLIERTRTSTWNADVTGAVLIDVVLGKRFPPPREMFHLVAVVRAEGLPILDESGRILCIVVRPAVEKDGASMCARREAIVGKKATSP